MQPTRTRKNLCGSVGGAAARSIKGLGVLVLFAQAAEGAQPLETETARLLPRRGAEVEVTYEHQFSSEGTELAVPTVFEYGLRDDLELLVEPVAFASIHPRTTRTEQGLGDLEATLTFMLMAESGAHPALALAGEVKVPTARNTLIGTGKVDYTLYVVASRRVSGVDLHGNLGYTFVGQPSGPHLDNIFDYALAAERSIGAHCELVAEWIGNTSSGPEAESSDGAGSVIPEAAGGESSFMMGGRWRAGQRTTIALGVSYDNNAAVLLRPGVTYRW